MFRATGGDLARHFGEIVQAEFLAVTVVEALGVYDSYVAAIVVCASEEPSIDCAYRVLRSGLLTFTCASVILAGSLRVYMQFSRFLI